MALVLCLLSLALAMVPSCSPARPPELHAERLFGPVLGPDPIVGRADLSDGRVLLLVRGIGIVRIDVPRREAHTIGLSPDVTKACWALARLPDGSLWTLKDRHTLARLNEAGVVEREFPLTDVHLGLVALGDRLVYERLVQPSLPPVFESGPPGEAARVPWKTMEPRRFELAAASALPLNLFACGESRTGERPCWFPDETAVTLVADRGGARRLDLDGLARVAPEVLLTSETPARPIRGALVDFDGTLWILASGAPPVGATGNGAWRLARYDPRGRLVAMQPLPVAARAILQAEGARAILLASNGDVVEVHP